MNCGIIKIGKNKNCGKIKIERTVEFFIYVHTCFSFFIPIAYIRTLHTVHISSYMCLFEKHFSREFLVIWSCQNQDTRSVYLYVLFDNFISNYTIFYFNLLIFYIKKLNKGSYFCKYSSNFTRYVANTFLFTARLKLFWVMFNHDLWIRVIRNGSLFRKLRVWLIIR